MNKRRTWTSTTYKVLSMIPADGYLAVYRQEKGLWSEPVIAWGRVRIKWQDRSCSADGPPYLSVREDGPPEYGSAVTALVIGEDPGNLAPAKEARNFIGCCRMNQKPEEVFADELPAEELTT
jgi:hypothetical protein